MFFLFRKKERTKEKSIAFGLFTLRFVWIRTFYGILYWEGAFAFFRCLSRPEPAALDMLATLPLTAHCYLLRFGIPRAGFCFLRLFAPAMSSPLRRLRGLFGALPALDHISEPSAGSYPPAAIWLYSRRCFARARHKLERARELHRIYPASA